MQTPSPTEPARQQDSRLSPGSRFRSDERGETALEYGLIASLIVLAMLATLPLFGNASSAMYNKISSAMSTNGQ